MSSNPWAQEEAETDLIEKKKVEIRRLWHETMVPEFLKQTRTDWMTMMVSHVSSSPFKYALNQLYQEMPVQLLSTTAWNFLNAPTSSPCDRVLEIQFSRLEARWGEPIDHNAERIDMDPEIVACTTISGRDVDKTTAASRRSCNCPESKASMQRTFECNHLATIREKNNMRAFVDDGQLRTGQAFVSIRDPLFGDRDVQVTINHIQGTYLGDKSAECTCPHKTAHPLKNYWCEHITWLLNQSPADVLQLDTEPAYMSFAC